MVFDNYFNRGIQRLLGISYENHNHYIYHKYYLNHNHYINHNHDIDIHINIKMWYMTYA